MSAVWERLSNTRWWRNAMSSAVWSTYAECCPDFRPSVLLSQKPSVYLTEHRHGF